MYLSDISNLAFYSQLSLKRVEDRLLLTADFPADFNLEYHLKDPFLYVTLYTRGGALIKIIDEATADLYVLTKKEIEPHTYKRIIKFAKEHAPQFKIQK